MDIENEQEESLRDTIANAMSAAEDSEPVEETPEPAQMELEGTEAEPEAEAAPGPEPKPGRDESGKFTKAAKAKLAPVVETKPQLGKAPVAPKVVKPNVEAVAPAPALKAPQSWKPGIREKFGTLPPEVQAEAVRVDREVQQVHRENATLKQSFGEFQQAMAPYQAMIQASGAKPAQIVQSLLGTAHNLQYGSAPQKAQIVAHLVKSYGVDIQALAAALDGQPAQGGAAQQAQQFDPNQVAAQVRQQVLEDLQRQSAERLSTRASSEIESWSANKEYAEDLRHIMADIIELDARTKERLPDGHPAKVPLTLDEAYERAAMQHPDIAPIFQQRQEAERVAKANKAAMSRRAAASSIRGQPSGDVDSLPEAGEDIRSDLIRAAAQLSRR